MSDGWPEVAMCGCSHEGDVSLGQRAVQPELMSDIGNVLLGGALADHQPHRIARQLQQEEDGRDHAEDDKNRLQQPSDDVLPHRFGG